MTHDEFVRRYGGGVGYARLWLSGWRPEDPLPERYWYWLGSRERVRSRFWFQPRDVVWGLRGGLRRVDRVRMVELLEQLLDSPEVVVSMLWKRRPGYVGWGEFNWVKRYCESGPCPRRVPLLWGMPRYVFPELVERVDDLAFWGYVWWLVMRGHPHYFDDVRAGRMFGVSEVEMSRVRGLMLDMGWFVPTKWDAEKHWWVREPRGLVAMG